MEYAQAKAQAEAGLLYPWSVQKDFGVLVGLPLDGDPSIICCHVSISLSNSHSVSGHKYLKSHKGLALVVLVGCHASRLASYD